jgi:hypothetical protein
VKNVPKLCVGDTWSNMYLSWQTNSATILLGQVRSTSGYMDLLLLLMLCPAIALLDFNATLCWLLQ